MLSPYIYVQSKKAEKWQQYQNFIFFSVWCKANEGLTFNLHLFDKSPELKAKLKKYGYSSQPSKKGKALFDSIKRIYELFAELSREQIRELKKLYLNNVKVERSCVDDDRAVLRFEDLDKYGDDFQKELKRFCDLLWDKNFITKTQLGDHYSEFKSENKLTKVKKCHICGISPMTVSANLRESYDHYLPRSSYPFISVNMKNLVPTCHDCNSKRKTIKDPLFGTSRRFAFYPYSASSDIELKIFINDNSYENLESENFTLNFTSSDPKYNQHVETWNELYDIERRYKEELATDDARIWIEEAKTRSRMPSDPDNKIDNSIEAQIEEMECLVVGGKSSITNQRFLKIPLLKECKRKNFI